MCGLFATTRPALWRPHLPAVLAALAHRGPDGTGVWESPDGQVLLAHTRLAIIGLGVPGAQPAHSADGAVALVYNGELYNFRDVAAAAGRPAPVSDTVVLADVLAADGAAGVSKLRGMFAFAAWDGRHATLTVARDRWGVKPLYVLHHADGGISVCSEIPPLLVLPEARTLDPIGLVQYLAFGHTGPDVTLFAPIRKLAPGTAASWTLGPAGTRLRTTAVSGPPLGMDGPADLAAAMADTVGAHLVSDVEVGVFLSGGIDSTLLAALARDRVDQLRTFTLSFPESPGVDESAMAAANARRLGTRHLTVPVTAADMVRAAATFVGVQGEPFGDAAALPLTVLAARAAGELKVVLAGEGADELFGAYGRYRVSRHLGGPTMRAVRPAFTGAARRWGRRRGDAPWARALEAAGWTGGAMAHAALLGSDLSALPATADGPAGAVTAMLEADWAEGDHDGRPEEEVARRFDETRWLANTYLEKTDRATMAASLEARVPYLDPVVAAAAARLPVDPTKAALRAELERQLPGVELPDRKKGLAVRLDQLLDAGLGLKADEQLRSPHSTLRQGADGATVRALAERASRSPLTRFRLAMLGQWEECLDGAGLR